MGRFETHTIVEAGRRRAVVSRHVRSDVLNDGSQRISTESGTAANTPPIPGRR
jgi:hypothetical protein